jgi:hypothetical protein
VPGELIARLAPALLLGDRGVPYPANRRRLRSVPGFKRSWKRKALIGMAALS